MAGRKRQDQLDTGNDEKRTNPGTKKLSVDMLNDIYVDPDTRKVDPRFGRDFVLERIRRSILSQLSEISSDDWIHLAGEAFQWHLDEGKRQKQLEAKALLDKGADDPIFMAALQKELAERLQEQESRISDRGRNARQPALVS